MCENGSSFSKKHNEFVLFMRNMIATTEPAFVSDIMLSDDNEDIELDSEWSLELEELFDSLFDSLD